MNKMKPNYLTAIATGILLAIAPLGCKERPKQPVKPNLETRIEAREEVKKEPVEYKYVNEFSEDYIINYTAKRVGVNPNLLKAIRKAENGKF